DAVESKLVLMHCGDVDAGVRELARVTRPGGRVAVFDLDFDLVLVDHPDKPTTRRLVHAPSDGTKNGWTGRQLVRRFREQGMHSVTAVPHTVQTPFSFFQAMVEGPLVGAREAGRLDMSAEALADWWRPLAEAEAAGRFFGTFAGFVV